jgi:hypothetical protein
MPILTNLRYILKLGHRKFRETPLYEIVEFVRPYALFTLSKYTAGQKEIFKDIKTFCLFIGHGRSGHSIIGSLLDSHPNIVLPDELDSLKYLEIGATKHQLYHLLLTRSQKLARHGRTKAGLNGNRYSYAVPNQWQGQFKKIEIIGDSKAGVSVRRLSNKPTLLQKLRDTVEVDIKFLQVIRNPYDNISTKAIREKKPLNNAIQTYFSNCQDLVKIYSFLDPNDLLVIRHEDLIKDPEAFLYKLSGFLGFEPFPDYIRDCAGIIYRSPAKSRYKIEWPPQLIEQVSQQIEKYDFLAGYSYEN